MATPRATPKATPPFAPNTGMPTAKPIAMPTGHAQTVDQVLSEPDLAMRRSYSDTPTLAPTPPAYRATGDRRSGKTHIRFQRRQVPLRLVQRLRVTTEDRLLVTLPRQHQPSVQPFGRHWPSLPSTNSRSNAYAALAMSGSAPKPLRWTES